MKDGERFNALHIDPSLIGLEKGDGECRYFCTPVGAKVIGWENDIHYCFIEGFGDMVFAVNPMPYGGEYVYPIARNFKDLLRLILYSGSITAIEQIVWFSKEKFEEFTKSEDNAFVSGQAEVLDVIKAEFGISPMDNSYEYVREIQEEADYSKIKFTDEYYDTLGLPYPDGREYEGGGFEFEAVEIKLYKATEDI